VKKRRRASVVCEADGQLLLVRLRDPVSGVIALYPPGGGVEPGEAPSQTARRETLEETGLEVDVDATSEMVTTYPFRWAGVDYDITTHWFRARLVGAFAEPPTVADAPYHLGALWLPTREARGAMAVHPAIASAVVQMLASPA
jgi:8-oxo-dGTP pyrophosphatase MutT (NUDIX family)